MITVSGEPGRVGHSSRWDGETTGKGTMTISDAAKPTRLVIKLDFAEPIQSQADTTFTIGRARIRVWGTPKELA